MQLKMDQILFNACWLGEYRWPNMHSRNLSACFLIVHLRSFLWVSCSVFPMYPHAPLRVFPHPFPPIVLMKWRSYQSVSWSSWLGIFKTHPARNPYKFQSGKKWKNEKNEENEKDTNGKCPPRHCPDGIHPIPIRNSQKPTPAPFSPSPLLPFSPSPPRLPNSNAISEET